MNNKPRILSKSISSLVILGVATAIPSARAATRTWDGGGVGGTDFGTLVNWSDDTLPDVITGDTALWDGTVAGPLALVYSDAAFVGAAGNVGINLSLAATQTGSLNIDSGTNVNAVRLNNISIAAGAGAFSLGNSTNTFNLTLGGFPGQVHTWTNSSSNTATLASDVVFGLGGGGPHTLAVGGAGNWTFNNIVGEGTGKLAIVKSGAGTLTLSGANTFTGGIRIDTGTVLATTNAAALGAGSGIVVVAAGANLNFGTANLTYGNPIAGAGTINANTLGTGSNSLGFSGNLSGFTGTLNIGTGGGRVRFQQAANLANVINAAATINVLNGGTLLVDNGMTYGNNITLNGGTTGEALGQLRIEAGAVWAGNVSLAASTTFGGNINGNAALSTISGVINGPGFGLTRLGTGTTALTNANTYTGTTAVNAGFLQLGKGGTTGTLAPSGSIVVTSPGVFAISRSNAVVQGTDFSTTAISGTGGFEQRGIGTTTLNLANTYTGATTVSRGTLKLDFSAAGAPATNIVATGSGLVLAHGTLNVTGKASTVNSQQVNGLTLNAGASVIQLNADATANPLLLALGTVTQNAGGTVDFTLPTGAQSATNGITTTTANTNGILGGYATVGGNDWAAVSGGNIVPYSTVGSYTLSSAAGTTAANYLNLNIGVDSSQTPDAAITPNSLRFNTAAANTLTLTGTNVVTTGGILVNSTVGGNLSTIAGGTLQGANSKDLVVIQNNTSSGLTIGSIIANNTAATGLTKSGNGVLTLTGVNTYTGNATLNAGTLNINNAAAIGNTTAGALVINGGTLDNTSGAAVTTTTAKTSNWNGDFTFTGSNDLSLAGGAVAGGQATVGGPFGTRTVTINAGTLTVTNLVSPSGYDFVKAGNGTLRITSATNGSTGGTPYATAANSSSILGMLNVAAGKIQVAGDTVVGGLTGSGTIENGAAAGKWFFAGFQGGDSTFSGTIQDGPTVNVRLGLVKQGSGTLTLSGTNAPNDAVRVEAGKLIITGTTSSGGNGATNPVLIGTNGNVNASLEVNGGTLNANRTASPSLVIAGAGNASGFLKLTSGAINSVNQISVGNGNGAATTNPYAAFTMSGGSVTCGSWLVVGANNDRAIFNQSGGTFTVTTNRITIGAGGNGSVGLMNLSGGTFTVNAGGNTGMFLGENGIGTLNMSGTGEMNLPTNGGGTSGTFVFGNNATSIAGTLNLNGGTLTTRQFVKGASTAGAVYLMNFNGGVVRPNANNASFLTPLANTTAYVNPGGARFDTNGFDATISMPLQAPTGSGVGSIAVANGGTGYIDTPLVTLYGGSGTGAQAVANVAGGVVTGFTITNPGVGYAPGDILSVNMFGGGATIPATAGAISITPNVGGGLTKSGAGTLTITGVNAYPGATSVTGGTLRISDSGSVNSGGSVIINGSGAKLVHTSTDPLTSPVTLLNGTLDGTGSISSVTVGNGTGGVITHGDGTGSLLTIGSLTFNGAATLNLTVAGTTPEVLATTTLNTNAAGLVTINATNTNGIWSTGVYNLISYSTLGGAGFSKFFKGSVPGLGARQSAALTNPAGFVALSITGDLPVWTGAVDGNWTTAAIASPKNWILQTAGTPTDFITGDSAVFGDTATGTTAINISTANVNPTSTTFNNSTFDYTVSSGGGFGIASGSLIKSGTAAATLQTSNTYAGGTTLNAGTLNINHSSAIGTGTFIVAGGTIDNTSGAPITLSTNNAQTWSGDFAFGGTNDLNLGTGAVALSAHRIVTTNGTGKLTVGGVISGIGFGFNKGGTGTLELTGASTYTGATTVENGTLRVTGAINAGNAANVGQITVGTGPDTAVMRIVGGTVNATKSTAPSIVAGGAGGSSGVLIMDGGTLSSFELWLGDGGGSYGGMTLNSGTVTTSGWLPVSRTGSAVLNVAGGSITTSGQNIVLSSFGGANGDLNASGGTITTTSVAAAQGALIVGEAGTGVLDVSGTAAINISGALGVNIARVAGGNGIVNLRGGTITTPAVTKGTSPTAFGNSAIFNFNGGTLRPTASSTTFMTGLDAALVHSGGAKIDTNGQNITISQPLLAPTASGVSSIVVDDGGAGYIHTPVVRLSGGTGSGATAVANITGGVITGITITNPGSGYAPDDVLFASIVGGGATTPATLGTITLAANNTTGGLTKQGAGTLTLSGTNTYTGPTTVSAGTLTLDATGTINTSSGITINGATARLLQSNTAPAITPTITVTNGLLDGTGTVNSVIVSNGTGGVVTNGNGGVGVLTIGTLFFSGVGTANINTTGAAGIATTGLTTNGVGTVTLNVPLGLPWATGSTYNLISYGAFSGAANHFVAGAISGLGARQIATPVINGSNIAIAIGGDAPVWTGASGGAWTTTAVGTPFNWKLQVGGTNTEFITNDQVLFNDTATGTTSITINDATVAAAGITFNNSTKNYTISGTNGITSGLLVKSGTGSLTISTANSYAGGTTLNAGTLNINNATAIGSGPLTINGGTIDNTSGGPIALTNNNNEFWNGDFNVGGTNNLNLGTGMATLGGSGSSRQITVNGGLVSIGRIDGTVGGGYGLTKAGAGTLLLGSAASTLNGDLNVAAGTLQIGASAFNATGLTGTGTIENGSATTAALVLNTATDKTFSGTLQNGAAAGLLGLTKRGTATQTLSGTNNFGSDLAIENGIVRITGTTSVGSAGNGFVNIGSVANQNAILQIDGGTLNAVKNTNPSLEIGSVANSRGFLKMSSGTIATTSELHVGQGQTGSYSAFSMSGGTVTSGSWLVVGLRRLRDDQSDGRFDDRDRGNRMTIGAGGAASVGVVNMSGGTFSSPAGIYLGENGAGILNISGSASLSMGTMEYGTNNAITTALVGTLNLGGGALNTGSVTKGNANGSAVFTFNFNGGTLRTTGNNAAFFADLANTEARVYSGGAAIDTAAFAIAIAEPLLAPTGSGVASIDLADGGAGYIDTPVVRLSGGIGTGATAVANVSGGVVTGFTITNPGSGYDLSDFLTATIEGGGATIPATIGTINLAGNATTGGLTKIGSGTLTLTGVNTYGGATTVNQGTLAFGVSETLSSLVIADGATVVLLATPSPSEGEAAGLGLLESPQGADAALASGSSEFADGGAAQVAAVPEPGAIGLLMAGALGLLGRRRRSSRTAKNSATSI